LPTILFVDPGEGYRSMARDALLEGAIATDLRTLATGAELLAYLERDGTPAPSLVLLDASLPGEPSALHLIRTLKQAPGTRTIPIVVLGEPDAAEAAYEAGANTYMVKPVTFLALVRLMKTLTAYWLEAAELPRREAA